MVNIRNINDIVLSLIDQIKISLPDADTKPGTVIRDLFIDMPAGQIGLIYDAISNISNLQSLRLVAGSDLDKLAQNLGATRKSSTAAQGTALLTFISIPATISINAGELITAKDGSTFSVINGISINPAQANFYRSLAVKFQNDLGFLGITDQFAVEVSVKATVPGKSGEISKYSLVRTSVAGVSNATNTFTFTGGSDQEDDATFRNRVLSIFSGSNIGTALGYKNLALSNNLVQDAIVIGPGDPLMTRDGTDVFTDSNGNKTIISEGTGGKVDIIILGNNIVQDTDTFIYQDHSNRNDPSDTSNIVVLGQIVGDENKTITQKRIDNIANGILPSQPVEELLQITGSLSGSNFIPKSVDLFGRVSGNYELIKDTGVFEGSPWGLDKFHWTSDHISLFEEDIIKSKFNGQDATSFKDVIQIPSIQQNIPITNENSSVLSSNRSIIELLHTPASNVIRVFNTNTGERYTVINQNLDNTGLTNTTGRVQISGNTLPSSSDILQVDYNWVVDYDPFSDYDGKIISNNPRNIADSIDWGIANSVRNERSLFTLNTDSTLYTGNVKHPISYIISANYFSTTFDAVILSTVPNFANRLSVNIIGLDVPVSSIESIKLNNTDMEVYFTASNDGLFINNRVAINLELKYNINIIFPIDTIVKVGDYVKIIYNQTDAFTSEIATGSFSNNQITIPSGNIPSLTSQTFLDITYISSVQDIFTCGITNLPLSRLGNGFITNTNTGFSNANKSNTMVRETQTIQKNISNQYYITLNLSSSEFVLGKSKIITVYDIDSNLEYWNSDAQGSIAVDGDGKYQVIFSGLNSPAIGSHALITYFCDDIRRTQPFTFENKIIKYNLETLQFNSADDNFYIPINSLIAEDNLSFTIIDPSTGLLFMSGSDGYFDSISSNDLTASFSSLTSNFSTISNLDSKILHISNSSISNNNYGDYNILNTLSNTTISVSSSLSNINTNQISVIRLKDNKELWSSLTCDIDIDDNILTLPSTILGEAGDKVIIFLFTSQNIHQTPTKLSITVSDQITNSGVITTYGTSITKVSDIVFTCTSNGLSQNVLEAMKKFLNISSVSLIENSNYLSRILTVEKVSTTINNEVLTVDATYDTVGSKLKNNIFYANEMLLDIELSNMDFTLPSTQNNVSNSPVIGDKLRITFYYATDNTYENVYFTRNGTLYTNKKFALINQVFPSSGFSSSRSTRFLYSYFTQPPTGSRYKAFYDYIAPKPNERIIITYNTNKAISDTTFIIENSRPINADVLVKEATKILIDATLNIVLKPDFIESSSIVLQNVRDRITSTINTNTLGDIINSSDLIAGAQSVDGVDRARIIYFNKDGEAGQKLSIIAQKNEYFSANIILVNQENR